MLNRICKFLCALFSLCMIIVCTYFTIYFTSADYALCVPIRNCTYEVHIQNDSYWYNYVVNNQYKCLSNCSNITDSNSCPINGSECHITSVILSQCRIFGFKPMFNCNGF